MSTHPQEPFSQQGPPWQTEPSRQTEPKKSTYKPFTIVMTVILGLLVAAMLLSNANWNSTFTQTPSQLLISTSDNYFDKIDGKAHVLEDGTLNMDFYASDLDSSMRTSLNNFMTDLGFQPIAVALMWQTTGYSGVQTAEAPDYTASWTYNSRDGLELSVSVKQ